MAEFKLRVEVVPKTAWRENLRNIVPRRLWDRIRHEVYAAAEYQCEICGAEGRLNCHELWEYDEERAVQRLTGFQAACSLCTAVQHFGLTMVRVRQGRIDLEDVVQHFMAINHCTREDFERHAAAAERTWERRSKMTWSTDYGEYAELVP